MQIQITGRHFEVTPALRAKAEQKLQALTKHLDHIIIAHLTFKVEKIQQFAEVQLEIPGKTIFAEAVSEDMYKTLDLLEGKLKRQLDKLKDKRSNH